MHAKYAECVTVYADTTFQERFRLQGRELRQAAFSCSLYKCCYCDIAYFHFNSIQLWIIFMSLFNKIPHSVSQTLFKW